VAPCRAEGLVLQRDDHRGQAVLNFGLDDVAYLASESGAAALDTVAGFALTDATRIADIAAARAQFGDLAPALVETTLLRRRAAAKLAELGDVSNWLFTDEALQQASAAPVALHRARRLAGLTVHDATCSIGTELAALRGSTARVLGTDIDAVRLAMARHNLGATADLCRADALHPVTRDATVVVDPARRRGGRRKFDPRDYQPGLDQLLDVYRGRNLVVKCAPGIDFDQVRRLGFDGEIEVTSCGGSVREACLWTTGLTEPGIRRRASILDRGEQITDADPHDCPVRPAGRWIIDPDGAVVRAGLVRHYAARHGLWQLDPDIAYLSGDRLPPAVRGFEVLQQLPFDERRLRRALGALDCGSLEILVRGVGGIAADPDALRRRLRLRGSRPLSAVITRIGSQKTAKAMVYICRPSR
jgi:THUMP domain-like